MGSEVAGPKQGHRLRLERRRRAIVVGLALVSTAGFAFGLLPGLVVLLVVAGLVFPFGAELSRPRPGLMDHKRSPANRIWAAHLLFVPLSLVWAAAATGGWPRPGLSPWRWEDAVLLVMVVLQVAANLWASAYILAHRGSAWMVRRFAQGRRLIAFGAAWFVFFMLAHVVFWTPTSSIHYLRVALVGGAIPFAAWCFFGANAVHRILEPVSPRLDGAVLDAQPSFVEFRG